MLLKRTGSTKNNVEIISKRLQRHKKQSKTFATALSLQIRHWGVQLRDICPPRPLNSVCLQTGRNRSKTIDNCNLQGPISISRLISQIVAHRLNFLTTSTNGKRHGSLSYDQTHSKSTSQLSPGFLTSRLRLSCPSAKHVSSQFDLTATSQLAHPHHPS
jgi:hypothetical protein